MSPIYVLWLCQGVTCPVIWCDSRLFCVKGSDVFKMAVHILPGQARLAVWLTQRNKMRGLFLTGLVAVLKGMVSACLTVEHFSLKNLDFRLCCKCLGSWEKGVLTDFLSTCLLYERASSSVNVLRVPMWIWGLMRFLFDCEYTTRVNLLCHVALLSFSSLLTDDSHAFHRSVLCDDDPS